MPRSVNLLHSGYRPDLMLITITKKDAKMKIGDRAMAAKDVMDYFSISRATLHNLTKKDQNFPKPAKISAHCVFWDRREIEDWAQWMDSRGLPIKKEGNKKADISGKVFGKLTVIRDTGERKCGRVIWECLCECGNLTRSQTAQLNNGKKKSCGCMRGAHLKADYDCLSGVD